MPVPETFMWPPFWTVPVTLHRKVPPDSLSVPAIVKLPEISSIVPPECVTVPALTAKFPLTVSVFAETVRLGWVPAPVANVTDFTLAAAVLTTG